MENTQVVLNNVRLSYVHLTKPYVRDNAEPKYSCTILLPKSNTVDKQRMDSAIQAAIQKGLEGKWMGKAPAQPPTPVWDGDGHTQSGNEFGPECKGCYVLTASTKADRPVEIVGPNLQKILDPTQVYSGIYANICINFFPYSYNGRKGIGCGLGPVQKIRDGEPLGGQPVSAESVFNAMPAQKQQVTPAAVNPLTGQPMQQAASQQSASVRINPLTGQPM